MTELFSIDALCAAVAERLSWAGRLICAFDGRCASGKTTAAEAVASRLGGGIVHADDFFLPPSLRTPERYAQPGGNIHHERLLREVITPLTHGETAEYGVFDCGTLACSGKKTAGDSPLVIVEGAYCLHPALGDYFGLAVFFDVDKTTQRRRILARNGAERLKAFESRWIPLEEAYIAALDPARRCEYIARLGEGGERQC